MNQDYSPSFDPINDADSHRSSFRTQTKGGNRGDVDALCDLMSYCDPDMPDLVPANEPISYSPTTARAPTSSSSTTSLSFFGSAPPPAVSVANSGSFFAQGPNMSFVNQSVHSVFGGAAPFSAAGTPAFAVAAPAPPPVYSNVAASAQIPTFGSGSTTPAQYPALSTGNTLASHSTFGGGAAPQSAFQFAPPAAAPSFYAVPHSSASPPRR